MAAEEPTCARNNPSPFLPTGIATSFIAVTHTRIFHPPSSRASHGRQRFGGWQKVVSVGDCKVHECWPPPVTEPPAKHVAVDADGITQDLGKIYKAGGKL